MTVHRCRRDMLEVAEHAPGVQQPPDLFVQLPFPFVGEMMNRKARDHRVERTERRQRLVEIVGGDVDSRRAGEPLSREIQHVWGEVERDADGLGPCLQDEVQQPAITTAQIEHPRDASRELLEQDGFARRAMRDAVGAHEITGRVFGGPPFVRVRFGHFSDPGGAG